MGGDDADGNGAVVTLPDGYDTVWVRLLNDRWNVIKAYILEGDALNQDLGLWAGGARAHSICPDGSISDSDGTDATYGFSFLGTFVNSGTDFSDVLIRVSHDSSTKNLTFGYSLDNGSTYQDTYVMNPTSTANGGAWFSAPTDGYSFRILARNTAGTVEAGLMFADNFSVTPGATAMVAVPEPSTYAAIAGAAALGLAFWHRRRQARRAS